jgi:hypothetical protein
MTSRYLTRCLPSPSGEGRRWSNPACRWYIAICRRAYFRLVAVSLCGRTADAVCASLFPRCWGRGLGSTAESDRDTGKDAASVVADARLRRRAERLLPLRRHALPSIEHPGRLRPATEGIPELLVAQPQSRLLAGRHQFRSFGLPGLASQDPAVPRIDDATWDREVTAVNRFYA